MGHAIVKIFAVAGSAFLLSAPASAGLRLGPGAVLEWDDDENGQVVIRRAGRFSSEDVHRALFRKKPVTSKTVEEMKAGIGRHIQRRYAGH